MSKVTSTKDQDQLLDVKTRLWIFDLATERQEVRAIWRLNVRKFVSLTDEPKKPR
ncbi:MAG: hypothetical protein OXE81_08150 [Gammaproteobacteria bacterium]|nr:hypothetical protein [Aestuariivita sp.]MCY4277788.1 hypothetical protein [Gammaproteobacteria bacterium]